MLSCAKGFESGNGSAAKTYLNLFILVGDANHDRTVGPADFNVLASHFGQSGQSWATGDFDGDGTVGAGDFNLLASRFGTTLVTPAAALSSMTDGRGATDKPSETRRVSQTVLNLPVVAMRAARRLPKRP